MNRYEEMLQNVICYGRSEQIDAQRRERFARVQGPRLFLGLMYLSQRSLRVCLYIVGD
jgi:hypothetical protein